MAGKTLYVAFVWHMHQPYYKDPFTGIYRLPWVRLHGVKDYLDMVTVLSDFPAVRQTFNLVPSLLEQLVDYIDNGATDIYLALTTKNPSDLTEEERRLIIQNFFYANWDTMIKPFPRYYELLVKRGFRFTKNDISRAARYFDDRDIRDLQVLFNLAWIDPMFRNNSDPFLNGLVEKGKDFTEQEKQLLITKQFAILGEIIPAYKRMSDSGQVELSVTPFYHPILPLIWDTNSARIGMPQVTLPKKRFSHPEDAVRQIEMAIAYFERLFGRKPAGMWPSEGSVSEDVVRAIGNAGIKWIATDEEVLARSLHRSFRDAEGRLIDAATLYRPHQFSGVSMLFRDHRLSDLIGFTYSGWKAEKAVEDFMGRLADIRNTLPGDRAFIVPIILDGENAWEYFANDGHDFLAALYRALSNDDRFRAVTVSDFIREHGAGEPMPRLHAGSWINANFGIWLGHEEDNLAWDYLSQTRDDLELFAKADPGKDLSDAWSAIYAAEGSDWNWWYGDEHTTETQEDFDELFRSYLMKVYKVMGKDIPPQLHVPILIEDRSIAPVTQARGFIQPRIDGYVTSYYEWNQAAFIDVKRSGGSMHRSESIITSVYYGFNKDVFFLRIDPKVPFTEMQEKSIIHINIVKPFVLRIIYDAAKDQNSAVLYEQVNDAWKELQLLQNVAALDIFELGVAFADLKVKENDEIHFSIEIMRNGEEAERCPWRGYITVTVPSPYYETLMWY
ncbi:MAG: glycoside hydrolase family 57 protein [Dissulfurispiraceae bacterium]|jgi:alpha-amylase/alpha-mannosidase (GH57 family)